MHEEQPEGSFLQDGVGNGGRLNRRGQFFLIPKTDVLGAERLHQLTVDS
jgi:hypothetical protein